MPDCTYGAEPKPTAPEFFVFDESDLVDFLPVPNWATGLLAGWLTRQLIGLPTAPVETAPFCAAGPPADLPSALDYSMLTTPALGWIGGAYQRIGNQVRYGKWSELCQCKLAPGEGGAVVTRVTCTGATQAQHQHNCAVAVSGATRWTATLVSADVDHVDVPSWGVATSAPADYTAAGVYPDTWGSFASGGWAAVGATDAGNWAHDADPAATVYLYVSVPNTADNDLNTSDRTIVVDFTPVVTRETAPTPPAMPTAPDGFPAAPGCPTVSTTQDLANMLCDVQRVLDAANGKLDYLANVTLPPVTVPDDAPTPVTDPTTPLAKPSDAIGVLIDLTPPITAASYGANPGVVYGRSHASLAWQGGWLPSVLLKHRRQIIFPIPPQCEWIGLDLETGASAAVTWLRSPK